MRHITSSRELHALFAPQTEQLEIQLTPSGAGWAGRVSRENVVGEAWIAPLGPHCLLVEHVVTPLEPLVLEESTLSDYACLCLAAEDTAGEMPSMVHRPHALVGGEAFSFLQPAGSLSCAMGAGKTYRSRSVTLLPGYFRDLERRWPGGYAGLFGAFDDEWDGAASRAILNCLRGLGPRFGAGAGLFLESQIERLMATLADEVAERSRAQHGVGFCPSASLAAKACAYIEANLADDLSIAAMASALYASRSRLCATFRAERGQAIAAYVCARRMEVACDLLATTSLPVAEIGRRVGYPCPSGFSTAFSRECGLAPSVWRLACT